MTACGDALPLEALVHRTHVHMLSMLCTVAWLQVTTPFPACYVICAACHVVVALTILAPSCAAVTVLCKDSLCQGVHSKVFCMAYNVVCSYDIH